jgi:hypothetical protein
MQEQNPPVSLLAHVMHEPRISRTLKDVEQGDSIDCPVRQQPGAGTPN